MKLQTTLASALAMTMGWLLPSLTSAAQTTEAAVAVMQSAASAPQEGRYDLGAVVDTRHASAKGVNVLAVSPGAAADRIGLRAGDQLRAVNGRRLDNATEPAAALESALQEGNGSLRAEIVRDGRALLLSGRADLIRADGWQSCGWVTDREGVTPRSRNIFRVEITQVEGRSTPLMPSNRHRVDAGKRVLVVREFISGTRLNSAQLLQIAKMKKFAFARAYKSLVVDVQPGMSYRIGARLLKDKLDTQSIRDNAYWEPVVWEVVPQTCP